jgi:hypothetical protein
MQSQSSFDAHLENAFASCSGPCKSAAIGWFVGSDLFNFWEAAIKKAADKHKNVTVVVDQPGNFDPATALRVMQDGLRAHPDIQVAVSPWDDETRGLRRPSTTLEKAVRMYGYIQSEQLRTASKRSNKVPTPA